MIEERREALAEWLRDRTGAERAEVVGIRKLSGGAIQENWALDADFAGGVLPGLQAFVLRSDAPSRVSVSRGRPEEFALLRAAHAAGVTVPEPLWQDAEGALLDKPFFVMRRVAGEAAGRRLVKDAEAVGGREALTEKLGRELARIHHLRPPRDDLAFLGLPHDEPARQRIEEFRAWLDARDTAHPALEWGLRWLERHLPRTREIVLCHNDFRTGNYMAEAEEVTGILDWEFAGWGDPMADIGWFCAPCWRFGAREREAGGVGSRESFYRGYEAESGRRIEREAIPFWEAMATARWMVIALQQAERHVSGMERSLELALTAHVVPALELDLLTMTEAA